MPARLLALAAALFVTLLLATVVAPSVAIGGYRPDLLVLFVVAVAHHDGAVSGARAGFAAGLAADLLSGGSGPVGVGALILLLVGHVAGLLRPYLAGTALAGQVALAAGGTLAAVLAHGFAGLLLDASPADPVVALRTAVAMATYGAVLAPFVFRAVGSICVRFPRTALGVPASAWSPGRVSGQSGRP